MKGINSTYSFLTTLMLASTGDIIDMGQPGAADLQDQAQRIGVVQNLGTFRRRADKLPLFGTLTAVSTSIPKGTSVDLAQIRKGDATGLNTARVAVLNFDTFLKNANQVPADQLVVINGYSVRVCDGDGDFLPELDPAILRSIAHACSVSLSVAGHDVHRTELVRALDTHVITTESSIDGNSGATTAAWARFDRFGEGVKLPKPLVLDSEATFSLTVKAEVEATGITSADIHPIRAYLDALVYERAAA